MKYSKEQNGLVLTEEEVKLVNDARLSAKAHNDNPKTNHYFCT